MAETEENLQNLATFGPKRPKNDGIHGALAGTLAAAPVPGNPYEVRGYFIAGPAGFTYREDFTWKLSPTKNTFTQVSQWRFIEGPNIGTGGMCGARAIRQ